MNKNKEDWKPVAFIIGTIIFAVIAIGLTAYMLGHYHCTKEGCLNGQDVENPFVELEESVDNLNTTMFTIQDIFIELHCLNNKKVEAIFAKYDLTFDESQIECEPPPAEQDENVSERLKDIGINPEAFTIGDYSLGEPIIPFDWNISDFNCIKIHFKDGILDCDRMQETNKWICAEEALK